MEKLDEFFIYLKDVLEENTSVLKKKESFRVFHGRGMPLSRNFGFKDLNIDYYFPVLNLILYSELENTEEFISRLVSLFNNKELCIVLQRRCSKEVTNEIIYGQLPKTVYAKEDGLKYHLNFLNNQNIGFFLDMKNGRQLVRNISKKFRVLNLFSYTCALSVSAIEGEAAEVVNMDMSSKALSEGRKNHFLNGHDLKKVKFFAHNIKKSYSKIKRLGPYDLIVVDPPSDQGDSFNIEKDYEKIIKRMPQWGAENFELILCCNSPFLGSDFLITLTKENLPEYQLDQMYFGPGVFNLEDKEKGVKILHFKKKI